MAFATKRLQKELANLRNKTPPGIELVSADSLDLWEVDVRVLDDNVLYKDQTHRLRLRFSDRYPLEAPEVVFVAVAARTIPLHPHIYSNGVICLDLLGSGWSPVHTTESIAVSLQSMLTGNTRGERPEGDADLCRRVGANPVPARAARDEGASYGAAPKAKAFRSGSSSIRRMNFVYEDDTV